MNGNATRRDARRRGTANHSAHSQLDFARRGSSDVSSLLVSSGRRAAPRSILRRREARHARLRADAVARSARVAYTFHGPTGARDSPASSYQSLQYRYVFGRAFFVGTPVRCNFNCRERYSCNRNSSNT